MLFRKEPSYSVATLLSITVVAPLILVCGSPWLPESPRWLILKDRDEAGFKILRRLHHRADDPDEILAREEFLQIHQQVALDAGQKLSFLGLWAKPSTRKRLLMGLFVMCIVQSTGDLVSPIDNKSLHL